MTYPSSRQDRGANRSMPLKLCSLSLAIASALSTTIVMATEQIMMFDIPPQSLGSALNAYADSAKVQLSYPSELTAGLKSPGVAGQYTPQQALQKLLQGTGIEPRTTANGTITLEKTAAMKPQSNAASLPTVTVTGKTEYAENDPHNTAYNRSNASTATRTDTPIMDTPVSIQVVPQQVLKDQQAITLADGLKNVSGVQISPSSAYENFTVRGFDASGSTYRDGIREDTWAVETANVERLEVLKGPGAILYGRIEPGGMINRVLKKPLDTPYYALQQQFGSFDMYRTTLDATGPLNNDKSLTYRFNLAYQDNNSFRDFVYRDRIFLAPQLNWKISDRTEVGIGMEYQRDDYRWDDGFALQTGANRVMNLPLNRSLGDPVSNDHQERKVADLHWSYAFNDDWKFSQQFSTFQANYLQYHVFPWTDPFPQGSSIVNRGLWYTDTNRDTYSVNSNLTGHFDTFGIKHTLLIGHDYYRRDQYGVSSWDVAIPDLDLNHPIYGLSQNTLGYGTPWYSSNRNDWNGVYFQDQIVLWDKLHILGGGRHDWASFETGSSYGSLAAAETAMAKNQLNVEKFSPRVGILYRPWNWFSIYGNYTESLGSNNSGKYANGQPVKPMEAEQYEAGIKNEFFGGDLTTNLAYFEVRKTNMATADTSSAETLLKGYKKTVGEARSRGIEFDVSGQITPEWRVIGNYAWIETRVTKDNNGLQGNRLPNAPLHSANIWTKYELQTGDLKGLGVGTGVRVVSQRQGDPQNDYQLSGFATWDALASYKFKVGPTQLTAQFNAYNLLDKRYFTGANALDEAFRQYGNIPGMPRSFIGTIKIEY